MDGKSTSLPVSRKERGTILEGSRGHSRAGPMQAPSDTLKPRITGSLGGVVLPLLPCCRQAMAWQALAARAVHKLGGQCLAPKPRITEWSSTLNPQPCPLARGVVALTPPGSV